MADRLRHRSSRGERVDRSQGTGKGERWERIIVSGCWIWFRNYFRREKVGKDITLGLVNSFMRGLVSRISISHENRSGRKCNACTLRNHKNAYPTPLETILRAEEAVSTLLETSRALQAPRSVCAIHPDASPRRNFGRHAAEDFAKLI